MGGAAMRYDTEVYFCRKTQGEYNNRTGNYEAGYIAETMGMASVSNMREEQQIVLFGSLVNGACVVRLQSHYNAPFDYIRIGSEKYAVKRSHKLWRGDVFFCSGMQ